MTENTEALPSMAKALDELIGMFCGAADNLGDMPISEAWADKWAQRAHELLTENNYFHAAIAALAQQPATPAPAEPPITGRAAIVEAWNDLPDGLRTDPRLAALESALRDALAAPPATPAAQPPEPDVAPRLQKGQGLVENLRCLARNPDAAWQAFGADWAQAVANSALDALAATPAAQPAEEVVQRLMGLTDRFASACVQKGVAARTGGATEVAGQNLVTIRAALESALRAALAQAVPAGWRLVPGEPTEGMEQAAADYLGACVKAGGLWVAMLAAAPSATQEKPAAPSEGSQG